MINGLFIADIHIQGGMDSEPALALMKAADIAIERQVDVVGVPGDIYEGATTPEHRAVFKAFVQRIADSAIPLVILRGNHDKPEDLKVFHDPIRNIYVSEKPEAIKIRMKDGKTMLIHTIPHFNAGAVALMEEDAQATNREGTNLLSDIIEGIRLEVQNHDGPALVMFHAVVSGASLDNGYIPREDGIHLSLQALMTIPCPVIGGHYHDHQNVRPEPRELHPGTNVWYTGSPTRQNYGEAKGDKGCMIVAWPDGRGPGEWKNDYEFVSLAPAPMLLLDCYISGGEDKTDPETGEIKPSLQFDFQPALQNPTEYSGALVRFRYHIPQILMAHLGDFVEQMKDHFRLAKKLKIEPVPQVTTAVRCVQIVETETVEDALLVWMDAKGIVDERPHCMRILQEIMGTHEQDSQKGDGQVTMNFQVHEEPALVAL